MKQIQTVMIRRTTAAVLGLALGLGVLMLDTGQASAQAPLETRSVVQELKVTARVAPVRHIIVDRTGQIIRITSNTPEDVRPQVFLLDSRPANVRPLSDETYRAYRSLVPAGTARYGVLYERGLPVAQLAASAPFKSLRFDFLRG
jgi:hypothetical protein